jgi:hypothetical protein
VVKCASSSGRQARRVRPSRAISGTGQASALDESPTGQRALEFAADAAHRRGAALRALAGANNSEHNDPTGQPTSTPAPGQLDQLAQRYPGLDIHVETVTGRIEDALLGAGATAPS